MHENYHFVDFWIQGQKFIKWNLVELVLSIFGDTKSKSSNFCVMTGVLPSPPLCDDEVRPSVMTAPPFISALAIW